jgi:glycosyltransferase involved in cell wall biosynthesis
MHSDESRIGSGYLNVTIARAMTPLVSVIVPVFNAAGFVAQAVSSALASHGVAIEVIAIDDGSTDGTAQVLERFGHGIRTVRQEQGGPYRARNLGARLAGGEWLAFLDADDEWQPDKLIKQLALARPDVRLIFTDCENFGDCSRVKRLQSDSTPLYDGEVFEPLLLGNFISMSSVLMRRATFLSLGGFNEEQTGVQDWDLWLRYAAAGGRVAVVREPLTRYRIHPAQMTQNLDARAADRSAVVEKALRSVRGRQVSRHIASRARANIWQVGAWVAAPTHRLKAVRWFLRALRYWPWDIHPVKGIVKCCLHRV